MNARTYRIILRAEQRPIDPMLRMKIIPQDALRKWSFRCERIEEIQPITVTKSNPSNPNNSEITVKKLQVKGAQN